VQLGAAFAYVLALVLAPAPDPLQGATRRVSLGDTGQEGEDVSSLGTLDLSARRVAFFSVADNLVPGDTNNTGDVFVHDLVTGELLRASVDLSGGNPSDWATSPLLSADGRRVAFESRANDLVPGDTNKLLDVFVRDLELGLTLRASVADGGAQARRECRIGSISGDGTRVSFESDCDSLVPGDSGWFTDVFVRDLEQGWTRRVSVASDGSEANRNSYGGVLSADGRRVAFLSKADNLAPDDTNGFFDVYLHDLVDGRTTLVSLAWDGSIADAPSSDLALSGDGSKVLFSSAATNLVPGDTNGWSDVFLRDLEADTIELVSSPAGGGVANSFSSEVAISHDGLSQVFQSYATNLVPGDDNSQPDIFLRDGTTGALERVNLTSLGQVSKQTCYFPAISGDGRAVVFHSTDDDMVPYDLNDEHDVFVHERWGAAPTVASYCTPSATSIPGCQALLQGHGVPSLGAAQDFTLECGPLPGATLGLLRFNVRGPAAVPLGTLGGFDCIAVGHFDLPAAPAGGSPGQCDGALAFTLADLVDAGPIALPPGATVHTQVWLRDQANPDGFATSNGVWFQVLP
jgi:Tol biopolymer transport system component